MRIVREHFRESLNGPSTTGLHWGGWWVAYELACWLASQPDCPESLDVPLQVVFIMIADLFASHIRRRPSHDDSIKVYVPNLFGAELFLLADSFTYPKCFRMLSISFSVGAGHGIMSRVVCFPLDEAVGHAIENALNACLYMLLIKLSTRMIPSDAAYITPVIIALVTSMGACLVSRCAKLCAPTEKNEAADTDEESANSLTIGR